MSAIDEMYEDVEKLHEEIVKNMKKKSTKDKFG